LVNPGQQPHRPDPLRSPRMRPDQRRRSTAARAVRPPMSPCRQVDQHGARQRFRPHRQPVRRRGRL